MITFIQLKNGIIQYLDKDLVSKIDNQITKVGVSSAIFIADKKSTNIFNKIKEMPIIRTLELVDENGNIDEELLLEALKNGMKGKSISFDTGLLGTLTIYPEDLDKIKACLKPQVNEQIPLI